MRKLDTLLKNKIIDSSKLLKFGFKKNKTWFIYEKSVCDNRFSVIIKTDGNTMTSKIIEKEFDEEYTLVDVENAQGEFVGKIRAIYEEIIDKVIDECTTIDISSLKDSEEIKYWVFPANVKLFNIFDYFKENKTILWHQLVDAHIGDFVYIYVGAPYSAIMYKCLVRASRVNDEGHDALKLELVEEYSKDKYPITLLKENGLTSIRSERKIPDKTVDLLKRK